MAVSKERKEQLLRELARLEEIDRSIHHSMPVGGNANHERAQKEVGDWIREIRKELDL